MSDFYSGMAEVFDLQPSEISSGMELEEAGWDSLAIVSTIAVVDDVYGVALNANRLADCQTIGDIEKLIAEQVV